MIQLHNVDIALAASDEDPAIAFDGPGFRVEVNVARPPHYVIRFAKWRPDVYVECDSAVELGACVSQLLSLSPLSSPPEPEQPRRIGRPPMNRSPAEKQALHTASQARLRRERRETGLCILCNKPRHKDSKSLCAEHALLVKTRKRAARVRARERLRAESPRVYDVGGQMLSIYELAALARLSVISVRQRLRVGRTPELILRQAGRAHERMVTLSSRPPLSPDEALALLDAHDGNVSAAARAANLPRGTFRKRLAKAKAAASRKVTDAG